MLYFRFSFAADAAISIIFDASLMLSLLPAFSFSRYFRFYYCHAAFAAYHAFIIAAHHFAATSPRPYSDYADAAFRHFHADA